ncbi:MAG: subclass B1 metallo-beta-lactamase, partial [Marivirga sp.]|nr:subclass B1 metallo-beta-lactamase [Marivirga sp.]
MIKQILIVSVLATQCLISCNNVSSKQSQATSTTSSQAGTLTFEDSIVFQSENLTIRRISNHIYQHISFLNTESFGRVPCNGMLVVNGNEAIVFDTPADNESSQELIDHVTKQLNCNINAIVATHFHADCVAGLEKFHEHNIASYANGKTIELLKTKGSKFGIPKNGFDDKLVLNVGDKKVYSEYFGEGHTKDNVVGYFPD